MPLQDRVAIIDVCLHRLHDMPRAKVIFKELRATKQGEQLIAIGGQTGRAATHARWYRRLRRFSEAAFVLSRSSKSSRSRYVAASFGG